MSTRGAYGVRIDGVDKVTYNHGDSYPEGLGSDLVKEIWSWFTRGFGHAFLREELIIKAGVLELVPSTQTWYDRLRTTQGSLSGHLLDSGIMIDNASFLAESLYCEWAYIVNFDEMTFEVYKGFQKKPHYKGRYGVQVQNLGEDEFYPVALVGTYPLDSIPSNWAELVNPLNKEE
jgi:hypothetical protein